MKAVLLIVSITISLMACITPIKPIPPIGCMYEDALLINNGNSCYWVYVNCGL